MKIMTVGKIKNHQTVLKAFQIWDLLETYLFGYIYQTYFWILQHTKEHNQSTSVDKANIYYLALKFRKTFYSLLS